MHTLSCKKQIKTSDRGLGTKVLEDKEVVFVSVFVCACDVCLFWETDAIQLLACHLSSRKEFYLCVCAYRGKMRWKRKKETVSEVQMSHSIVAGTWGSVADCCIRGVGGGEQRRKQDEHLPYSDIAPWFECFYTISWVWIDLGNSLLIKYLAGLGMQVQRAPVLPGVSHILFSIFYQ